MNRLRSAPLVLTSLLFLARAIGILTLALDLRQHELQPFGKLCHKTRARLQVPALRCLADPPAVSGSDGSRSDNISR